MINNKGKINILIVVIIVLVQLLISLAVYFFVIQGGTEEPQQRLQTLEKTETRPPVQQIQPRINSNTSVQSQFLDDTDFGGKDYFKSYALFSLGDMVITPTGSESRYFLVTITLEYRQSDKRLPQELANKTPVFKDRIIHYFSRLPVEELRSLSNRDIFKEDLMRLINSLLLEGRITNVLFEQYIIQ